MFLRYGLLLLAARGTLAELGLSDVANSSLTSSLVSDNYEDFTIETSVLIVSEPSLKSIEFGSETSSVSSSTFDESGSSPELSSSQWGSSTASTTSTVSSAATSTVTSAFTSIVSSASTYSVLVQEFQDLQKPLSTSSVDESSDKVTEHSALEADNQLSCSPDDCTSTQPHELASPLEDVETSDDTSDTSEETSLESGLNISKVYEHVRHINLSNISNIDLSDDVEDSESGNNTDDCRFMSFEEWKKHKNLVAQARASSDAKETSVSIDNSLEIVESQKPEPKTKVDEGRTRKYEFNYASSDCAATVVSTNSDAKGASAILKEIKDSYLMNKCTTPNKFVVIELCQDILVSRIVMGNFELFSSMFKSVKFSVSESFPVNTEWKELGVFEAENIRDLQTFDIENPLIWARYLRIDMLSHYDNEFYCPISLVRVHGTTMIEEFKGSQGSHISQDAHDSPGEDQPTLSKELLNYTTELSRYEDECRVVFPYLELNEFLKDINGTDKFCVVPLAMEESTISAESTTVKTTQESILKTIVKRLSLLESNASLSLLYVEEQSKLLSNAFTNLEKRHASKFDSLIQKLNQTVTAQVSFLEATLNSIRSESKLLFQNHDSRTSTLLASVDEKNYTLMRELSFQRKIIAIDTFLILALLAYVIFTREFFISEESPLDAEETPTKRSKLAQKQFSVHSSRRKSQKKKRGRV